MHSKRLGLGEMGLAFSASTTVSATPSAARQYKST